jgi:hypothetical protein
MSVWMSEKDFRAGGAEAMGVTINVPFLQEIKQDSEFRQTLTSVYHQLNSEIPTTPRVAAELLSELRDQLETYLTLEEFYGYFRNSAVTNPSVSRKATELKSDHEQLFLQFNQIVETSEQIVYHECSPTTTVKQLAEQLDVFCQTFAEHEDQEMALMMQMCNQDIGVGD